MPPRIDLSRRSPEPRAKADPYANKTHRRIDILLVAITLVLMFFAFHLSAHKRASSRGSENNPRAAHTQSFAKK
jgi:hypothetical protein